MDFFIFMERLVDRAYVPSAYIGSWPCFFFQSFVLLLGPITFSNKAIRLERAFPDPDRDFIRYERVDLPLRGKVETLMCIEYLFNLRLIEKPQRFFLSFSQFQLPADKKQWYFRAIGNISSHQPFYPVCYKIYRPFLVFSILKYLWPSQIIPISKDNFQRAVLFDDALTHAEKISIGFFKGFEVFKRIQSWQDGNFPSIRRLTSYLSCASFYEWDIFLPFENSFFRDQRYKILLSSTPLTTDMINIIFNFLYLHPSPDLLRKDIIKDFYNFYEPEAPRTRE